jgi:hypothetical protein
MYVNLCSEFYPNWVNSTEITDKILFTPFAKYGPRRVGAPGVLTIRNLEQASSLVPLHTDIL